MSRRLLAVVWVLAGLALSAGLTLGAYRVGTGGSGASAVDRAPGAGPQLRPSARTPQAEPTEGAEVAAGPAVRRAVRFGPGGGDPPAAVAGRSGPSGDRRSGGGRPDRRSEDGRDGGSGSGSGSGSDEDADRSGGDCDSSGPGSCDDDAGSGPGGGDRDCEDRSGSSSGERHGSGPGSDDGESGSEDDPRCEESATGLGHSP